VSDPNNVVIEGKIMGYESHESLSAAMDGEVSSFELRRLVERLPAEQALEDKWQRYHLSQHAMHNGAMNHSVKEVDLVSRVQAALKNEEALSGVSGQEDVAVVSDKQWWKPFASMAVAASATAVVILGGQSFTQEDAIAPAVQSQIALVAPTSSPDIQRTQYGNLAPQSSVMTASYEQPDVIRLSQGLKRYIDQHNQLLSQSEPAWEADWLPEGYSRVRHEVMPHAEIMVYSNGRHDVSVSIEPKGRQTVPAGVTQSDNVVAVGVDKGQSFVTVVGDVPLMIADRIAASVNKTH